MKKVVSQLEKSFRERNQKADDSPNPDTESAVAKLNSEIVKVKAESASQQDVFSRKIDEMARASDETLLKYTTQIGTLHAVVLRLRSRSENKSEARSSQNESPPNPKTEVSVASTPRSMTPGTTPGLR